MPRWFTPALAALAIALIAGALAAPLGPIPGFRLGGTPADPPEDWSGIALPETVQLETTGGILPRVVNIWIVAHDGALWVLGDPASGWVRQATADGAIRLRVGDAVYALTATRVHAPDAYRAYLERYREGYPDLISTLPPPEASAGVAMFRLDRT